MGQLAGGYANGSFGAKRNPQKAKIWLIKAAKAGVPHSASTLGQLYYMGGPPTAGYGAFSQSMDEAHNFFLLAADYGDPASYLYLAQMHRTGHGVTVSLEESSRYASLAVYQNAKGLMGKDILELIQHYWNDNLRVSDLSISIGLVNCMKCQVPIIVTYFLNSLLFWLTIIGTQRVVLNFQDIVPSLSYGDLRKK